MNRARAGSLLSASLAAMTAASLLSPVVQAEEGHDVASARGRELFETYCVLCHGAAGKGDGRAASLQKIRPSDLTASARSDEYKLRIISEGGAALSRSEGMPPWKTVLSRQQIADVVVYLRAMVERGDRSAAVEAQARANGAKP
jgi:cytochrome c oxidase cbb3-type subunit III